MDFGSIVDSFMRVTILKERVEHEINLLRRGEKNDEGTPTLSNFRRDDYLEELDQRLSDILVLYNKTRDTYKNLLCHTPNYEIEIVRDSLGYRLKACEEECLLYNKRIDEANFNSLGDASVKDIKANDEVVSYVKERLIDKIEEKRQLRSFIYYLNKELEERKSIVMGG